MDNKINIAVNICTYNREEYIKNNISKLMESLFFDVSSKAYYGHLYIFVTDNASKLDIIKQDYLTINHNRNSGGSGGFQKGIEAIRNHPEDFSHVVFMDDDVEFEIESFYKLFDFLKGVPDEQSDRPIAGRMFRLDKKNVQYSAGEIWNGGNVVHVDEKKPADLIDKEEEVIFDSPAEYGGFWFCVYPYSFVKDNDILPFFLHCDDVEYGLRCGKTPIIIKGVQVWHEVFEDRISPAVAYYDVRNPLFVNKIYGINQNYDSIYKFWKDRIGFFHRNYMFNHEYCAIMGLMDYLKGIDWLESIDSESYHKRVLKLRGKRIKNAIMWRVAAIKLKKYIK